MPVRSKKKKTTGIKVDPAQLKSAREIFHFGPSTLIGVEPLVIRARKVTAQLVVKPHHMNRNHRVGGGILMAMADVMGAAGAVVNRPPNHSGGTIESKTNFFGAAVGPVLKATSVPLHIGRTTSATASGLPWSPRHRSCCHGRFRQPPASKNYAFAICSGQGSSGRSLRPGICVRATFMISARPE